MPAEDPNGGDATGGDVTDAATKRDVLRAVAADLRGEDASAEAERVAAIVMRVSDLYDEAEETTPVEIYLNMRTIMEIAERGGRDV